MEEGEGAGQFTIRHSMQGLCQSRGPLRSATSSSTRLSRSGLGECGCLQLGTDPGNADITRPVLGQFVHLRQLEGWCQNKWLTGACSGYRVIPVFESNDSVVSN